MKRSFRKIIAVVAIVLMATLLVGCGKNKGVTKGVGETLEASGSSDKIAVRVVSEPEKHVISSGLYKGDTYGRIKVELENKGSEELDMSINVLFALTDADKKDLATSNYLLSDDESLYGKKIAAGAKETGYIYFSEDTDDWDSTDLMSDSTISNAVYLRVSLMSGATKSGSSISADYIDNFIQLK